MKKMILLCSCMVMFLVSGCVGSVAGDIQRAMDVRRSSSVDTGKAFDETKVTYDKELRCYIYRFDDHKKDIDSILFDTAGKKIMTREEAIERVRFAYGDKGFSGSEKAALYATAVWIVPVGLVFGIAENIAMLPAMPYVIHLQNKFQKESFEYYNAGRQLLEQSRYPEAREKFFSALSGYASLLYFSDVYYQLAETYDRQGTADLARKYYQIFLEYSTALYPDYFKIYNPKLTNDRIVLDNEFTSAENKLKIPSAITAQQGPGK